jgi:hypothetical protein
MNLSQVSVDQNPRTSTLNRWDLIWGTHWFSSSSLTLAESVIPRAEDISRRQAITQFSPLARGAPPRSEPCDGRWRRRSLLRQGGALEITKALTTAQDAENRHQQQEQGPGRDADSTSHPRFRDGLQKTDRVKIGCGSLGLKQGFEAIPSRTTQAGGSCQSDWDRL